MDGRMKYVVVGAGGTGGGIGGFLARAGKNVTLIARGQHLKRMQEQGLKLETVDENVTIPVKACTMEEYKEVPDVVFVCVKGYSLEEAVAFIQRMADSHTVVIPILNIYGTGRKLQERLPGIPVTDGCIYIASEVVSPGTIRMSGRIFRVVYGLRRDTPQSVSDKVFPVLEKIAADLRDAGIVPVLSEEIERDALQKFSFVSPMAAIGARYDVPAAAFQKQGFVRKLFVELVTEIKTLSDAMGISLPGNIVEINLKIMDDLAPAATASMHRDIRAKKQSEVDGLVYEVVRLGKQYKVEVPAYEKIAKEI